MLHPGPTLSIGLGCDGLGPNLVRGPKKTVGSGGI